MKTEFSVPAIVPPSSPSSLAEHIVEYAERTPDKAALSVRRGDAWVDITARELHRHIHLDELTVDPPVKGKR